MTDATDRWGYRITTSTLPTRARLAALTLLYFLDRHGRGRPGVRTLAARTGLTTDTTAKALRDLVSAGYLEVVEESSGRRPTEYQIVTPNRHGE